MKWTTRRRGAPYVRVRSPVPQCHRSEGVGKERGGFNVGEWERVSRLSEHLSISQP